MEYNVYYIIKIIHLILFIQSFLKIQTIIIQIIFLIISHNIIINIPFSISILFILY